MKLIPLARNGYLGGDLHMPGIETEHHDFSDVERQPVHLVRVVNYQRVFAEADIVTDNVT